MSGAAEWKAEAAVADEAEVGVSSRFGVNSGPEGPRSAQICGTFVGWARSRELRGS